MENKGKLFVNGPFDTGSDFFIRLDEGGDYFDVACTNVDETGNAEAYAKRMVACFNACEGLSIEDILSLRRKADRLKKEEV